MKVTKEELDSIAKALAEQAYLLAYKDEDGNVKIPLEGKSVPLEIGDGVIFVINNLYNEKASNYIKEKNIDILAFYREIEEHIRKIVNNEKIDDLEMYTISILHIFKETWTQTMINNGHYKLMSKEEYIKEIEGYVKDSNFFKSDNS